MCVHHSAACLIQPVDVRLAGHSNRTCVKHSAGYLTQQVDVRCRQCKQQLRASGWRNSVEVPLHAQSLLVAAAAETLPVHAT
jgi:hypothetical protein